MDSSLDFQLVDAGDPSLPAPADIQTDYSGSGFLSGVTDLLNHGITAAQEAYQATVQAQTSPQLIRTARGYAVVPAGQSAAPIPLNGAAMASASGNDSLILMALLLVGGILIAKVL